MLQITVKGVEQWDDKTEEFSWLEEPVTLCLEHSLVSISEWESKWNKAFISKKDKTREETIDYIKCMTLTRNVSPSVYERLSQENFDAIEKYISAPMSATYFAQEASGKNNNEVVTSELIYYWMIALQIPFKCERWHLNRLLALIRVCNAKNQPPKKRGARELASRYAAQNAANRRRFGSKG